MYVTNTKTVNGTSVSRVTGVEREDWFGMLEMGIDFRAYLSRDELSALRNQIDRLLEVQ